MNGMLTALTQFGAAGLIGLLWILERRHATLRDRQLDEAHRRLIDQERDLEALLTVVTENTKAVNTLQQGQLQLIQLLKRVDDHIFDNPCTSE